MQQLHLQRALKFTTDDLKANRNGKLSDAQQTRNEAPKMNKLVLGVILVHALVLGGLLGAIAIVTGKVAMWIVLGIVMALALLPFVLMHNEGNINPTFRGDINNGIVKRVCGIAILTEHSKQDKPSTYELYIDGETFKLNSSQASAFIHEALYCVYYLPLSKTVISAEPQLD